MGMGRIVKTMKLEHKLMLPNALYLILLAVGLFFFFSSSSLIRNVTSEQRASFGLSEKVRQTALDTKGFINKEVAFADVEKEYQNVLSQLRGGDLASRFEALWEDVVKIDGLRQLNRDIENQVMELTSSSIEISNGYIKQATEKLVDETARSEVTVLERMTIIGANINTSTNYQLQVLFGRLKESLEVKDTMLTFLDTLLKNVEKDIKQLAGTPFEKMPVESRNMCLKIQELTKEYIENAGTINALQANIFEGIDEGLKEINGMALSASEGLFDKVRGGFRSILAVILIASILGILISFFTARSLSRLLSRIAHGLGEASDQVASAANEVSSASQSLAEGSSEQAASLEETSSSLEEMASQTARNAENASQADGLMKNAGQVVAMANGAMEELTGSMTDISEASEETQKIVKTIDEISFQTNLLALNAAVEAARAGEAGAGFAVVADEVRNLALRAADAARNTAELIEKTSKKIQDGSALVARTNDAFGKVSESSVKVGGLVEEIAAASREQAEGIDQVNKAIGQMDAVIQQSAANSEENASASEEMNAQAEQMKEYVAELLHIVEGGSKGRRSLDVPPDEPPHSMRGRSLSSPTAGSLAVSGGRAVGPETVLPLNREEGEAF